MPRKVPEWIGKTDDARIPPRVKQRVLERYNYTCALSGNPIHEGDPPEFDHIKRLKDGGEHRESNLQPVIGRYHKIKSKKERAERALSDHQQKAALKLNNKKSTIPHHPSEKRNRATRPIEKLAGLPRRKVFEAAE